MTDATNPIDAAIEDLVAAQGAQLRDHLRGIVGQLTPSANYLRPIIPGPEVGDLIVTPINDIAVVVELHIWTATVKPVYDLRDLAVVASGHISSYDIRQLIWIGTVRDSDQLEKLKEGSS